MPKKANKQPPREMTRRQLSHWQRENRLQRFVLIGGIIVIIAVLAIVGTGVYFNKFRPYQAVVIKADGASYDLNYYINLLTYIGLMNGNPQYIQYFTNYAAQMIEQDYFYIHEAAKIPLIVTDDEVNTEIKKEGVSSNQAIIDAVRWRLLAAKLKDYYDKDTSNPDRVPTSADSKMVQAMFLESQGQVKDIEARLHQGEKFGDIAAQISLQSKSKSNSGDFGWVPPGVLPSLIGTGSDTALENKVFNQDTPSNTLTQVEDKDLAKDVGYWLIEVTNAPVATPTSTPTPTASPTSEVHVLAILVGSEQQAAEIKAKLDAGGPGNDFASLAKQYSLYADAATNGGDLGLKKKGDMPAAIDKLIFPADSSKSLEKNKVYGPIQDTAQNTSGGNWLLQISETQNKEISSDYRTILINNKVKAWQDKVWNDNKDSVQNLLTSDQTQLAVQKAQSKISQ